MEEQFIHERVRLSVRDGLARVTLARPDKYNGLDFAMMEGLVEAARQIRRDRRVRAVIMDGEGEAFCAGLDFATVTRRPVKILRSFTRYGFRRTNLFQRVCWCWRELPVPVIAVLHGYCYGGGMQIALAADFRIARPDCEFSIMEIKWGLIPDMTGSVTLRELVPIDTARELTMTGRRFTGAQARQMNLVTRVADNPRAEALSLAEEIATRSPDAVSASKALFRRTWAASERKAFRIESSLQWRLLLSSNRRRAMEANRDKRPAEFGPRGRNY